MAVKITPGGVRRAIFNRDDLDRIQAATGKNYELVRGELFETMPPSLRHGRVVVEAARLLANWAVASGEGEVFADNGYTLERDPDTVRGPDVSFIRAARLTAELEEQAFPEIAPDLAVEVRSPSQRWRELDEKAEQYFRAGCRMVWFLEIDRFLEILRPNGERQRLGPSDSVKVDDVLPGFRCRVSDFFPARARA